jgi:hypothetical protein
VHRAASPHTSGRPGSRAYSESRREPRHATATSFPCVDAQMKPSLQQGIAPSAASSHSAWAPRPREARHHRMARVATQPPHAAYTLRHPQPPPEICRRESTTRVSLSLLPSRCSIVRNVLVTRASKHWRSDKPHLLSCIFKCYHAYSECAEPLEGCIFRMYRTSRGMHIQNIF